jgi:hypothetical protein
MIKTTSAAARMWFLPPFCKYYGKLDGEPEDDVCMYQAKVQKWMDYA